MNPSLGTWYAGVFGFTTCDYKITLTLARMWKKKRREAEGEKKKKNQKRIEQKQKRREEETQQRTKRREAENLWLSFLSWFLQRNVLTSVRFTELALLVSFFCPPFEEVVAADMFFQVTNASATAGTLV